METGNLESIQLATSPPTVETDRIGLADDFDEFLLLLTTELQNQDPTEPMDSHEFTSQLVQFASVEQAINQNENLEEVVKILGSNGVDAGVQYLDQVVEADGNGGFLVNGSAPFVYELPTAAEKVSLVIQNARGDTVYTGEGATQSGKNTVIWDGIGNHNAYEGVEMPEGDYYLLASASGFDDETIEVKTYTSGVVTAVNNDAGDVSLTVGNISVPLDEVAGVRVN